MLYLFHKLEMKAVIRYSGPHPLSLICQIILCFLPSNKITFSTTIPKLLQARLLSQNPLFDLYGSY